MICMLVSDTISVLERIVSAMYEVVTGGGALGKINHVGEQFVTLEIAPNIEIKVQKPSIQTVLPKGTIKGAANS